MDTQQKDLSYFRLQLQELVNTSYSEKANHHKFIEKRSVLAIEAYEVAFRSVNSIERCNKIANNILFDGLHFSKLDTVFQVVCNEFDTIMADEELRPFALKMLPICELFFNKYELNDDFTNGYKFDQLYTEITGNIAIWIEENELQ